MYMYVLTGIKMSRTQGLGIKMRERYVQQPAYWYKMAEKNGGDFLS
jgi:hypothetical protein